VFGLSRFLACLLAAGAFVVLALLRGQSTSVDLTTVIFTVPLATPGGKVTAVREMGEEGA